MTITIIQNIICNIYLISPENSLINLVYHSLELFCCQTFYNFKVCVYMLIQMELQAVVQNPQAGFNSRGSEQN